MSDFQLLVERYYQAWFRFHPETAVDLGIRGYAHRLTPCDDDDIGALTSLNEKLLASLEEVDLASLTPAEHTDLQLLYGAGLLELEELGERDWRRRDPVRFLPINAIYQLTVRKVDNLQEALRARLEAIPHHLREARTFLRDAPQNIPVLWLDSAITEARQGVAYLRDLRHHPQLENLHLDAELETAGHEVEQFADFLERSLKPETAGDFACGRDYFEDLLKYRHGLNLDADTLHAFGQQLFDRTRQQLQEETRRLTGSDDMTALVSRIQADHPPASELLSAYRQGMQEAHEFIQTHALVRLPIGETLKVVETPCFLRHEIPFAAYLEPMQNDPQQKGIYYVTPAQDEAALGVHNTISLRHTCVHEAWPGHHLQFVTANQNPRASTLPRLTNPSATMYEGWALYCEQLMQEQGFLDAPESRFVLLRDRLWRAMRVMLDVELHCRGLSIDEAVSRMQASLGFSREQAMGELSWYTRMPTVPMGYAVGWALINACRDRLQDGNEAFDLTELHARLLAEGSIGLSHVLRRGFGEPLWQSIARDVLGA